jgi:hypothetical protein
METTTIDMTPTWAGAVRIYMMALEHGTEKGKQAARAELMRLAEWADQAMAKQAAEREVP